MEIDLELVRARWKKCRGRRSGKTIEAIIEFLGVLEYNPTGHGMFLVTQIRDLTWIADLFQDITRQMGFPELERQGMCVFKMGDYTIKFVSQSNKQALHGRSDWALGGDHKR